MRLVNNNTTYQMDHHVNLQPSKCIIASIYYPSKKKVHVSIHIRINVVQWNLNKPWKFQKQG